MKFLHSGLFAIALVCGIAAMGCWVLTQADAGISKEQGPVIILIVCLSSILFLLPLALSAYLRNKMEGTRSIAVRTVFLVGVCGILVVLFFVVTSRGLIFKFGPFSYILLGAFVCFAVVSRIKMRSL